jgi:8-oxo-dGTP pyrophosphatase MutT (NUDIX family)
MDSEFSAGGVVVDGAADAGGPPRCCLVIVPTRRAADGSKVLALPKGHPDGDETPEQAAMREVREEAGVETELIEPLGDVRYFYQRRGRRIAKVVRFFLLRYRSGDPADHDDEVEDARWMELDEAARKLTYTGERRMVKLAAERLRRGTP